MIKKEIKWMNVDSADGNSSSYHGYYSTKRTHEYFGEYNGNASLCNKNRGIIDEDGECFMPIEKLEQNGLKVDRVCKSCLKIYDKLEDESNSI